MAEISVARVKHLYTYDPVSGCIRAACTTRTRRAGEIATEISFPKNAKPWAYVYVDGVAHSAKTAAWILHYDELPQRDVRFVNGDTTDMRLCNLVLDREPTPFVTPEDVRKAFDYDAVNGRLVVKMPTRRSAVGAVVGHRPKKYGAVRFNGRNYQTHVLIWVHQMGEFPDRFIDHINGDKSDNRMENLRLATPSQNRINEHKRRVSASGIRGVIYCKSKGKFKAEIQKDKVVYFLGHFDTKEEAAVVRRTKEVELYGEFSRYSAERS